MMGMVFRSFSVFTVLITPSDLCKINNKKRTTLIKRGKTVPQQSPEKIKPLLLERDHMPRHKI